MAYIIGLIIAVISAWLAITQFRRHQREKLFRKPLPTELINILETNVPLYKVLPPELRQELHGCINLFLDEKEFIGCAGMQITDEVRLTIAGNASILLLKRDPPRYTGFTSILVYPETYVADETEYDGLVEVRQQSARAGESWHRGPVVLAWENIMHDRLEHNRGHNVILHEFAHKLDEENEIMDGLPILRNSRDYKEWAEVLRKEYDELQHRVHTGSNTVLDDYATVSPPEFFAVATETFFGKPVQMKTRLPELYEQLRKFYDLDPATWHFNP